MAVTQKVPQDNGLAQVLSDVLEEVKLSINRDISGADLLHSLLSAPWLRSLLKVYECLLQNKTSVPTPHLPYSSGLSQEVMANLREVTTPTPDILELYRLLEKPHVQALLLTHDTVAKRDYDPVLPPMPHDMPLDEEAIRIVCMVKNKQPLSSCPSPSSQSPLHTPSHTPSHTLSPSHSNATPSLATSPQHPPSPSAPTSPTSPFPSTAFTKATESTATESAATGTAAAASLQTPKVRVRSRWDHLRRAAMEATDEAAAETTDGAAATGSGTPPQATTKARVRNRWDNLRRAMEPTDAMDTTTTTGSTPQGGSPKVRSRWDNLRRAMEAPDATTGPQGSPKARANRWDNLRRCAMEKLATSKILSLTDGCAMDNQIGSSSGQAAMMNMNMGMGMGMGGGSSTAMMGMQGMGLPMGMPVQKCLLVQYDPLGNQLCYQTCELMGAGLAHSAPSIYAPAVFDNMMVDMYSHGGGGDTTPYYQHHSKPGSAGSLSPPLKKSRNPPGGGGGGGGFAFTRGRHPPLRQRSATVPSSPQSPSSSCSSSKRKGSKPPNLPPLSKRDSQTSQTAPSSPGGPRGGGGGGGSGGAGGRTPASSSAGLLKQRSVEERRGKMAVGGGTDLGGGGQEEDAKALRLLSEVGATIKKDLKTKDILVARVIHGGLADRSGLLSPGDKLLEVNGRPMRGMDPEHVIQILTNSRGTLVLKVIPNSPQPDSQHTSVFMRALTDYAPVQDPSIPCAAAGMAFSKGDLLEVVDQTDALWWQARKLHSANPCAGLIPSTSALKKKLREVWFSEPSIGHTCINPLNSMDEEDDDFWLIDFNVNETDEDSVETDEAEGDYTKEGIYTAGFRRSIRLWRRRTQSNRRQSCQLCCPSNSHGSLANPYEEVVTFQRNPEDQPRLIALIGPSGVGVNELRKRIIKINPYKFQGAIPHTTRPLKYCEQAGREYHFISRELFEYMAYNRRFLEYGEFKGYFYGTSVDAIKEVIDSGRVCIIDIEPHSLQSIRTKLLQPFIIYIKPPSLERLRHTRRNSRIITHYHLDRSFREEDFREMEASSGRLEGQYGHLFDRVLVNEDLRESSLQLFNLIQHAQDDPQWIPKAWTLPDDP